MKPSILRKIAYGWFICGAVLAAVFFIQCPAEAAGQKSALEELLHSYNFGSGALIINPLVILIQWANFLILLILLNKILYKPLLKLMNERQGKIDGDLSSAERDRSEALGYVSQYEDSLSEIQRENTDAVVKLQQEMTERTRVRIEEIRVKTDQEVEEARVAIRRDAEAVAGELKDRARGFAADIANRLAGRAVA
ncbi:MAG: ATP synthase F0 subunit B [bacterium]|nr:ATP synthase F0 subunit B [bacterium]